MKQQPKLWDSQTERERERTSEKEMSCKKLEPKALPAHSHNKGLSKYQRRASLQQTSPLPTLQRQAGNSQSLKGRGKLGPRDGILYQTASRLPVANQFFLGSWTVDIHQEGRSQRSVPQRRHTAHLRRCSHCAPRKPNGWDQVGDKMHCS